MNTAGTLDPSISQLNSSPRTTKGLDHLEQLIERLERLENTLEQRDKLLPDTNTLSVLVFEGTRDRLLAAFAIATGAAACGMNVKLFFAFWATPTLRKGASAFGKKTLVERAFGWMLPSSFRGTKLSQMDMLGVGRKLMEAEMKRKNIADLDVLLQNARELGVQISVCEMSMKLMGIRAEELIDYPNLTFSGVAKFVEESSKANTTLFI